MLFKIKDLYYQIGHNKIIKALNFELQENKINAFIGPNGSGKTTLLRLLSGEIVPSNGSIRLDGRDLGNYHVSELSEERSMLSQKSNVPLSFKSYEIVAIGAYHKMKREGIKDELEYAKPFLEMADVLAYSDRLYNTLSGGESKRVDFARMLAQQTKICFLDEPTNHLDPYHQIEILKLCKKLVKEGKTVVVSLHDLNLAAQFADFLYILKEGEMYDFGKPEKVLDKKMLTEVYNISCEIIHRPNSKPLILPNY